MSTLENNVDELKVKFDEFEKNISEFEVKKKKVAGTRARKNLMEISKLTKIIRKEIQEEIERIKKEKPEVVQTSLFDEKEADPTPVQPKPPTEPIGNI